MPGIGRQFQTVDAGAFTYPLLLDDIAVIIKAEHDKAATQDQRKLGFIGMAVRAKIGFRGGGDQQFLYHVVEGLMDIVVTAFARRVCCLLNQLSKQVVGNQFHDGVSPCVLSERAIRMTPTTTITIPNVRTQEACSCSSGQLTATRYTST